MCKQVLNITNGEYFNQYLISKTGEESVPFCEAIMDGEVVTNIYSEQFISLRAKALNVSEDEYRAKMYVYNVLQNNEYKTICLWFGKDTFCQINLLTLLAYLEQIQYCGYIKLNYIDDETFELLESNIDVKLGRYRKIYEDILISKRTPQNIGILSARAIDLYFEYHSERGVLANLVRVNSNKETTELIALLLEESKEYGLSDLQAGKLIKKFGNL